MAPLPALNISLQLNPCPLLPRLEALDFYCVKRKAHKTRKPRKCMNPVCKVPKCDKISRRKGLCFKHGGKIKCKITGCTNYAHTRYMCIKHGGGQRCKVENCTQAAQLHQRCCKHGGRRLCTLKYCFNIVKAKGLCGKHLK